MNRNRTRKPTAKVRRGLHKIETGTYAHLVVQTKSAPVQTKVIR